VRKVEVHLEGVWFCAAVLLPRVPPLQVGPAVPAVAAGSSLDLFDGHWFIGWQAQCTCRVVEVVHATELHTWKFTGPHQINGTSAKICLDEIVLDDCAQE
jgi:hypothetical protein